MRKQLTIPFTTVLNPHTLAGTVSSYLNGLALQTLNHAPWADFAAKPEVSFSIAHCGDCLFVKFYVKERFLKAVYRNDNGPVYKDSCVEIFIAFENNKNYYNLEFNCAGTCLAGFGPNRTDRISIPLHLINSIKRETLIKNGKDGLLNWELTLSVPLQVFRYDKLGSFYNKKCWVNFFKCGDELPEPHYLAWNNILGEDINFHQPDFFGTAVFEGSKALQESARQGRVPAA